MHALPRPKVLLSASLYFNQAHLSLEFGGWGWEQSRMGKIWTGCKLLLQQLLRSNVLLSARNAVVVPLFLVRFVSTLKSAAISLRR